jgi:hypothetical protein
VGGRREGFRSIDFSEGEGGGNVYDREEDPKLASGVFLTKQIWFYVMP